MLKKFYTVHDCDSGINVVNLRYFIGRLCHKFVANKVNQTTYSNKARKMRAGCHIYFSELVVGGIQCGA